MQGWSYFPLSAVYFLFLGVYFVKLKLIIVSESVLWQHLAWILVLVHFPHFYKVTCNRTVEFKILNILLQKLIQPPTPTHMISTPKSFLWCHRFLSLSPLNCAWGWGQVTVKDILWSFLIFLLLQSFGVCLGSLSSTETQIRWWNMSVENEVKCLFRVQVIWCSCLTPEETNTPQWTLPKLSW